MKHPSLSVVMFDPNPTSSLSAPDLSACSALASERARAFGHADPLRGLSPYQRCLVIGPVSMLPLPSPIFSTPCPATSPTAKWIVPSVSPQLLEFNIYFNIYHIKIGCLYICLFCEVMSSMRTESVFFHPTTIPP